MRVKIFTLQSTDYLPGDFFRVMWDGGTGGELSTLVDKVPVFPSQELGPCYSQRVFSSGTFGGGAKSECTYGNRTFGAGSFAVPMGSVELVNKEIKKAGMYQFAIQSFDFLGNAVASANWKTFNVWICETPAAATNFKVTSFDQATNALVFGFKASRSL